MMVISTCNRIATTLLTKLINITFVLNSSVLSIIKRFTRLKSTSCSASSCYLTAFRHFIIKRFTCLKPISCSTTSVLSNNSSISNYWIAQMSQVNKSLNATLFILKILMSPHKQTAQRHLCKDLYSRFERLIYWLGHTVVD